MKTTPELMRLVNRNAAARYLWHRFLSGELSMEECVVAMAVHFAEAYERLLQREIDRFCTSGFFTTPVAPDAIVNTLTPE